MAEGRNRIKRQIELLGLVIAEPCRYKVVDLELYFNCTQITVKRDLRELRSLGIDIHSLPRKGIRVDGEIRHEIIMDLLAQYVITSGIDSIYQRSLHFFAEKHKTQSIPNFTKIQTSIENNLEIEIEYYKREAFSEIKVVSPLLIFLNENEWRLLAFSDGKIKHFLLSKIHSVKVLEKSFPEELKQKAKEVLWTSFGSWIGENSIEVKLKFTKDWLASGKEPKLMEFQQTVQEKDGSRIVTFKVNSLEEIARWVAGRGGEVIVEEPENLRNIVLKLAEDTIIANKTT
ncbi:MAG: WYL domain-containing protein [Ignavibacteria bacterium]|nr:WYL domain-containing protein [Ignavibacteria bacterium]MCU7522673.1 WYL domain-containing protein [Ignavibacteria bacterium]